jgi:hypothetical protein
MAAVKFPPELRFERHDPTGQPVRRVDSVTVAGEPQNGPGWSGARGPLSRSPAGSPCLAPLTRDVGDPQGLGRKLVIIER